LQYLSAGENYLAFLPEVILYLTTEKSSFFFFIPDKYPKSIGFSIPVGFRFIIKAGEQYFRGTGIHAVALPDLSSFLLINTFG
jgi:hypothetical protein